MIQCLHDEIKWGESEGESSTSSQRLTTGHQTSESKMADKVGLF